MLFKPMRRAFTLVELLVVVGILGILMAVLVGTFGGSTDSARTTQCLSNLRNLAMAVQSTAMKSENPESCYFPFAGSFRRTSKSGVSRGWIGWDSDSAGDYVDVYEADAETRRNVLTNGAVWVSMNGNSSSYVCPEHMNYARQKNKGTPLWSYAMNAYFGWSGNMFKYGRKYTGFRRADKTLLFAELPYMRVQKGGISQDGEISGQACDPVLQYSGGKGGGDECIGFNHRDGKNYVAPVCFADGHVEKLLAPKTGDVKDLTKWLCRPTDNDGDFDVSYDGRQYKQVR